MSVQRIDTKRTHGWQARAYLNATARCRPVRLTAFFADRINGGTRNARRLAREAEATLKRKARRLRAKAPR